MFTVLMMFVGISVQKCIIKSTAKDTNTGKN